MPHSFKSGFISIIGKPNVGKSTLLNTLIREKIAIVSEKPETTRDNIHGVLTTKDAQIVFIDTPGMHKPRLLLGKKMVEKVKYSIFDGDLLLFMVELTSGVRKEDISIMRMVKDTGKPAIALINKIDAASKGRILPIIKELKAWYNFIDFIPVSALTGDNITLLKDKIFENLSIGDKYYPDNQITDKDEVFHAQEIIREKVLLLTREEVPHSVAVKIEKFSHRKDKDILDIEAVIYVERDSQKGIIVGKRGAMVKEIAMLSREDLEEKFRKKVFLSTWVKVLKNWRKSLRSLRLLGID